MKTEYAPDNTRTSILVVLGLAAVMSLVAVLIGLSDKPQVDAIGITAGSVDGAAASAVVPGIDFDDAAQAVSNDDDVMLDEAGEPFDDEAPTDEAAAPAATDDERPIIVVPTSEPTATPEVAAAVEPTPVPGESEDAASEASAAQAVPSLPSTSGSVQGTFFTKSDENEGAVVAQNLITVSFAEDGSGAFQGVLDITYLDGTHILLNMSGPLTWAPSNPQVEATLAGAFTLDAPIDADDVVSDDAELSISSLEAGSGSLCTTKCFGFTFPPQ